MSDASSAAVKGFVSAGSSRRSRSCARMSPRPPAARVSISTPARTHTKHHHVDVHSHEARAGRGAQEGAPSQPTRSRQQDRAHTGRSNGRETSHPRARHGRARARTSDFAVTKASSKSDAVDMLSLPPPRHPATSLASRQGTLGFASRDVTDNRTLAASGFRVARAHARARTIPHQGRAPRPCHYPSRGYPGGYPC